MDAKHYPKHHGSNFYDGGEKLKPSTPRKVSLARIPLLLLILFLPLPLPSKWISTALTSLILLLKSLITRISFSSRRLRHGTMILWRFIGVQSATRFSSLLMMSGLSNPIPLILLRALQRSSRVTIIRFALQIWQSAMTVQPLRSCGVSTIATGYTTPRITPVSSFAPMWTTMPIVHYSGRILYQTRSRSHRCPISTLIS